MRFHRASWRKALLGEKARKVVFEKAAWWPTRGDGCPAGATGFMRIVFRPDEAFLGEYA